MAPEPGSSSLVTQDKQETILKTDSSGNWTLEKVQRNQSGTYGCRAEDFDATDDAELSQTLELHVACESPGRARRGPWHLLPPFGPDTSFLLGTPPQAPPGSCTRQPESPFQGTYLTFSCSGACLGSPVRSGEGPDASPRLSRPTCPVSPVADPSPHQGTFLVRPKLLSFP